MTVDQYLNDLYNNIENLWGVLVMTMLVALVWLLILSAMAHGEDKDQKKIALLEKRADHFEKREEALTQRLDALEKRILEEEGQPRPSMSAEARTVKSALEDGIHELASVEQWRTAMVAQHGELSPEMEELFGKYRQAVRDRSVTRFERELADILGMEVER